MDGRARHKGRNRPLLSHRHLATWVESLFLILFLLAGPGPFYNPCDPLVIVQFLIDSKDSPRVTECIWTLERGTRTESVLLCLIDTWPLGLNLPSFFLWVPVCSFPGNLVGPLIDSSPLALGCLKFIPAITVLYISCTLKIFGISR